MPGDRPLTIPSTLQRRPSATRLTWALRATCLFFVLWSVRTMQRTWQEQPVRATVETFFQALINGDNEAALNLIEPEVRQRLPREAWTGHSEPLAETALHIQVVQMYGTGATVVVTIQRGGYELAPTVTLRRQPDGVWRLTQIAGVGTDPRWLLARSRIDEEADDSLFDELQAELAAPVDTTDR